MTIIQGLNDSLYPLYTAMVSKNSFNKNNGTFFCLKDNKHLVFEAQMLENLGVTQIVSNAHKKSISDLYPMLCELVLELHSMYEANEARRAEIKESVFVSRNQK